MRAVPYARYSTDLQRPESVEDQFRVCRDLIARQKWEEVGTYHDAAISGDNMILRPGIQQLIMDAKRGKFDVVVAEALDRISRDQADLANLFKLLKFHDVAMHTLSEGAITPMHVGFKGTMNAIFLDDLVAKIRRGLRGRVVSGYSGGGNCYGYNVIRHLSGTGDLLCGEREINEEQANIIRRIFREFSAGVSPTEIARRLNDERIPGPRGTSWSDGTIRGQGGRGTGILNNEMYLGRRIWNRLRYIKDPETGKRVSRKNPPGESVVSEVPELRIVDDDLWQAVKERQREIAERMANNIAGVRAYHAQNKLNAARRPKSLLSGLIICGCCGGPFSLRGGGRYACSNHISKRTCTNSRSIPREVLERRVLIGIKDQLMDEGAVAEAVRACEVETNRLRQEGRAHSASWEREMAMVKTQIGHVLEAVADGMHHISLKEKLTSLETRRDELAEYLTQVEVSYTVRNIPQNASKIYASKVERLLDALHQPEEQSAAREAIRYLIEKIVLTPGPNRGDMDAVMYGDLGTILDWTSLQPIEKPPETGFMALRRMTVSESVVAGAGF
ncbi:recombinase family protein, partial [Ensifer aridi]|uniref:recombinase family protein n=1 Tax=Ensifer aridi TaxID=1708715 RepID=UPI000A0FF230